MRDRKLSPNFRIVLAFATIYLLWGSTYLGIRIAVQTIPPLLMAGVRFFTAGAILYVWMRRSGVPAPTPLQWRSGAIIGGLLLLVSNGAVTWGEQQISSGLAALSISVVPLWMVLLDWLRPGGTRPTLRVIMGLLLGLVGLVILFGPGLGGNTNTFAALVIVVGAFGWAIGSLYSRTAPMPSAPLMGTATEMLMGGGMLVVAGLVSGEVSQFKPDHLSLPSVAAVGYLVVFGALIGFSAYTWLLRVTTPARASSYAYVNPVVAVFLGWALAGEPLTRQMLLAAAIIITGVVVVVTANSPKDKLPQVVEPEERKPEVRDGALSTGE